MVPLYANRRSNIVTRSIDAVDNTTLIINGMSFAANVGPAPELGKVYFVPLAAYLFLPIAPLLQQCYERQMILR